MGTGGRRGRRDNGLVAAEYAAAGDVDPRVGEHLLDVLGVAGIAAYLQPTSDLHPVTRTNTVPARPTDRLYVDRNHLTTARHHLRRLEAEAATGRPGGAETAAEGEPQAVTKRPGEATPPADPRAADPAGAGTAAHERDGDIDAEWARIVAGLHAESLPGEPGSKAGRPWPEPEEVTAPRLPRSEEAERSLLDALDTFGADLPDTDDEGYTPPPPPPLPRPSGAVVLGVIGIVGGLVVFLRPATLPVHPDLAMFLGFTAVLCGFAALVWRLRSGEDEDSDRDPDDGAVV